MTTPLVEMDSDEMTRILWKIKPLLFFFIMILLFGSLLSCSNDDDVDISNIQKEMVGKWQLVEWPGVDLSLSNINAYYEFNNNFKVVYTETSDRYSSHFEGTYSFEKGWKQTEGKLEGYMTIKNSESEIVYHCWLQGNTMMLADRESEPNNKLIVSAFRTFERTK